MANHDHVRRLLEGVGSWNQWRDANPTVRPNLSGARLHQASLEGANLSNGFLDSCILTYAHLDQANLSKCDITGANLDGASLHGTSLKNADLRKARLAKSSLYDVDLSDAKLNGAYLDRATLREANLSGANLAEAVLTRANLIEVRLDSANLSKSLVGGTTFCNVDLRRAIGLDTVEHLLPSTVGIDTIIRSKGKIAESFLRGAGVPDHIIKALPLLAVESEYYSCFFCSSSKDEGFAQQLYGDLQDHGVLCYFAKEHMRTGDEIRPTIDHQIRQLDKMLIILSESSVKSEWVEKEVETAFEEERRRKQPVLFPVRLDSAVMDTDEAWAADIRRMRHIGDFSQWVIGDMYREAFNRLLNDLRRAQDSIS